MSGATPRRVGARRKLGGGGEGKTEKQTISDVGGLDELEDAHEEYIERDGALSFFGSQEPGGTTIPSAVCEDWVAGEAQEPDNFSQESIASSQVCTGHPTTW